MFKKGSAAFKNVAVSFVKIVGVPRVSDFGIFVARIFKQKVDFILRVGPLAVHIVEIFAVHTDQKVIIFVIGAANLPCTMICVGNIFFLKFHQSAAVHSIAKFFCAGGGGINFELTLKAVAVNQIFHHKFCHWRAANVSVANKKNSEHSPEIVSGYWIYL